MTAFNIITAAVTAIFMAGAALAQSGPSGHTMPQHGGISGTAQATAQGQTANGSGIVRSVDATKRRINLSHEPMPAINWPAMTMEFDVAPGVDLSGIQAGQPVEFTLKGADGTYTVIGIAPRKN